MKKLEFHSFKRVTKQRARKLYNEGKDIYLDGCKMIPFNGYGTTIKINIKDIEKQCDNKTKFNSFDFRVNNFKYFNCNYEIGYYPSFYIKSEV